MSLFQKIPDTWRIEKIDNIKAKSKNAIAMGPFGSRITRDKFVDFGIPIIRGNNLKPFLFDETEFVYLTEEKADELSASAVKRGDIVITHRGTLGQVGYIPKNSKFKKYIVSQSGMKLTCDESKVESKYLWYFFNSRKGQHCLLRNKSQVGVPSLAQPTTTLKNLEVPLPPLPTQRKIAAILSALDDKIENNRKTAEKLEEIAAAVFKRWFVDFEFPDAQGKPYKSSGGRMVESELGLIPEGWEVGAFNQIVDITSGKRPPQKSSEKSNYCMYPLVGASSIMGYTSDYNFSEPIFVIGRVGTHGVIQRFYDAVWISDNALVIKAGYPEFTFQILNNIDYKAMNRGSTQPLITQTDVKNTRLILPMRKALEEYEEIVGSFTKLIKSAKEQRIILQQTRDTLLPKLISGELSVEEVEV